MAEWKVFKKGKPGRPRKKKETEEAEKKSKKRMSQCYEKSYYYVLERREEDKTNSKNYRLVHGSVLARLQKGKRRVRIPHAWVEYEDEFGGVHVLDLVVHGFPVDKPLYYHQHKAKVHNSFTPKQAIETGIKKGFWGEWDSD